MTEPRAQARTGEVRQAQLDPPAPFPQRHGLRYSLSMLTLGKLERLARARFAIRQLTDEDLTSWVETQESREVLVQSVAASSEIEGQGIAVDRLPLLLAAVTEPISDEHANDELIRRETAIRSIVDAAIWALSRAGDNFVTYDFVLELHRRMFFSTRPEAAGRLKEQEVVIKGAGYHIATLPSGKTEEFLRTLCKRTNDGLAEAEQEATGNMFLTVAEFVSDLLAIHPFCDGNGRTARLLSTCLLERCGYHFARFYPVDSIILETRRNYYETLFLSQRNWYLESEDMTPWIDYYVDTIFTQWTRAYQQIKDEVNRKRLRNGQ